MQPVSTWHFNLADVKKVSKNALIFLAPVAITELTLFQQGARDPRVFAIAFEVWIIGIALDFFRKLSN